MAGSLSTDTFQPGNPDDGFSSPNYQSTLRISFTGAVKIKRDEMVIIDEHDTGLRMILNGHTISHAAEKLATATDLTHGQAVAIGMVAAMRPLPCWATRI